MREHAVRLGRFPHPVVVRSRSRCRATRPADSSLPQSQASGRLPGIFVSFHRRSAYELLPDTRRSTDSRARSRKPRPRPQPDRTADPALASRVQCSGARESRSTVLKKRRFPWKSIAIITLASRRCSVSHAVGGVPSGTITRMSTPKTRVAKSALIAPPSARASDRSARRSNIVQSCGSRLANIGSR